jgi:hypothetical protein
MLKADRDIQQMFPYPFIFDLFSLAVTDDEWMGMLRNTSCSTDLLICLPAGRPAV